MGGREESWRAEGGSRTKPMEQLLANMKKGLPVVTVSISEWWDKFQTYRRLQVRICIRYKVLRVHCKCTNKLRCALQHSTCTGAWVYAAARLSVRMSRAFMRVPTYVPSSVDMMEARDVVFYPLRRLETA